MRLACVRQFPAPNTGAVVSSTAMTFPRSTSQESQLWSSKLVAAACCIQLASVLRDNHTELRSVISSCRYSGR